MDVRLVVLTRSIVLGCDLEGKHLLLFLIMLMVIMMLLQLLLLLLLVATDVRLGVLIVNVVIAANVVFVTGCD